MKTRNTKIIFTVFLTLLFSGCESKENGNPIVNFATKVVDGINAVNDFVCDLKGENAACDKRDGNEEDLKLRCIDRDSQFPAGLVVHYSKVTARFPYDYDDSTPENTETSGLPSLINRVNVPAITIEPYQKVKFNEEENIVHNDDGNPRTNKIPMYYAFRDVDNNFIFTSNGTPGTVKISFDGCRSGLTEALPIIITFTINIASPNYY